MVEINIREAKGWKILDLTGTIRRKDAEELKKTCVANINGNTTKLAVNFEYIDFIDSIGLGALISCNNEVKNSGGNFLLMNLSENIYDLLEMTSVDKMFLIADSENELP